MDFVPRVSTLALLLSGLIGCNSGTSSNDGIGGNTAGGATSDLSSGGSEAGGSSPANATTSPQGGTSAACTEMNPTLVGSFDSINLTELSGLVASRDYPGTLYAHADSGNTPTLYVMNQAGEAIGTIEVGSCTDWEDVAIGVNTAGTDAIYIGDIGDNASRTGSGTPRTSIQVYRFLEPAPTTLSTSTALSITDYQVATLTYPDATHDAETLFVDPLTDTLLIVTKDTSGSSLVYRAPLSAFEDSATVTLEQVGSLTVGTSGTNSALITSGDISPAGDRILLRTYEASLLFSRLDTWEATFAATPVTLPSATEPQSEGLTFNSDGTAWLSAGEQSTSIYEGALSCE